MMGALIGVYCLLDLTSLQILFISFWFHSLIPWHLLVFITEISKVQISHPHCCHHRIIKKKKERIKIQYVYIYSNCRVVIVLLCSYSCPYLWFLGYDLLRCF